MTAYQRIFLRTPWTLVLVFLLMACCFAAGGSFYYADQKNALKRDKQNELLAIAELKARSIANWRKAHFNDSQVILNNPLIYHLVEQRLQQGAPSSGIRSEIVKWMGNRQQFYDYDHIVLLDPLGTPLVTVPRNTSYPITPVHRYHAAQAIALGRCIFPDLYRDPLKGEIRYEIFIPLRVKKNGVYRCIGVLLLQKNPYRDLFPLVQSWPTPSRTAEALLVRPDGNQVLFINELRHRSGNAMIMRRPMSETTLPAAMAAQGRTGIVEGKDYRGVPVLAAITDVPDSPWHIVAKIDAEEVYTPLRERAWLMGSLTVALIFASGVIVLLIWRQAQLKHLRETCDAEREHLALAQQYEALTRYANDGIILLDEIGGIVEANERAVSLYGYPREELLGLNIRDLKAPDSGPDLDTILTRAKDQGGIMFESLHRRRTGEPFPVEISSRILLLGESWFYLGIIRDISERREAEAQVMHKQRELEALNRTLEDRVREEVAKNREKDHLLIHQGRLAAMGEMIGNISHQWRQPLNVVGLLCQSIPEMYRHGELSREYLEDTVKQAMDVIGYMSQTMDDFRNFFKPDKEKREFCVREVVDQSLSLLHPHLNYHNITVEVNISRELHITGYPNEYAQVLINILGNSKDVILERGTENPAISISAHLESDRTIVTIRDNAGGIAEDVIGRIFDPYFTTKRTGGGSGLGLYMSKTIIEKNMLGRLTASNRDDGAEFRIEV